MNLEEVNGFAKNWDSMAKEKTKGGKRRKI